MSKILKNRALLMTVLGMVIMAQSILWEYVRVKPTYRFIVDPWSLRGYEVTQGAVIAALALGIAVLAILVANGAVKETRVHGAVAIAGLIGYVAIVALLADARDVSLAFPVTALLAAIGAVVVGALVRRFIPEDWNKRGRASRIGIWLVSFLVLLFGVLDPLLGTERPLWMIIAIAGLVLGALALFRPPTELAGRRMLINAIIGVWVMSMTMSAGLRQALLAAQLETSGISTQLLDLQITSGVLISWFGGLIGFIGAVGMWAKRRDQIIARERARRQQEAAADSAAQLQA